MFLTIMVIDIYIYIYNTRLQTINTNRMYIQTTTIFILLLNSRDNFQICYINTLFNEVSMTTAFMSLLNS